MKRKIFLQIFNKASDNPSFSFIVCASFFIFGAVFGSILSVYIDDPKYLYNFFSNFFMCFSAAGKISFWGTLFDFLRFLIIDLVLSVSAFGVIAIPAVAVFKGFLASFSVALIVRLFGFGGIPAAFAVSGIDILLFTPVFLCASSTAIKGSASLLKICVGVQRSEAIFPQNIWVMFLFYVMFGVIIAGIEVISASWLCGGLIPDMFTGYI